MKILALKGLNQSYFEFKTVACEASQLFLKNPYFKLFLFGKIRFILKQYEDEHPYVFKTFKATLVLCTG